MTLLVLALLAAVVGAWLLRLGRNLEQTGTTPAPPSIQWPDASNTGVPPGIQLSSFEGDCTITVARQIIDSRRILCDLVVRAKEVSVIRSEIRGRVVVQDGGSIEVTDSLIDGGSQDMFPAVGQEHVLLQRVDVRGGQHSVQCQLDCTIEDSWLHDQAAPSQGSHMNAFISNGGHGFSLVHNTIGCTSAPNANGGGCTADVSLFGDFAPITDAVFAHNLFKANPTGLGYCVQGGSNPGKSNPDATHIIFSGNVFEGGSNHQCGRYGPVTAFDLSQEGNRWDGNVWTDGTAISP